MNNQDNQVQEELTIKKIKRNIKTTMSSFLSYSMMSQKNQKYNKYNSNFIKTENSYNSFISEKVDKLSQQHIAQKSRKNIKSSNDNGRSQYNFMDCFLLNSPLMRNNKLIKESPVKLRVKNNSISVNCEATPSKQNVNKKCTTLNNEVNTSHVKALEVKRELINKIDKLDPRNLNKLIKRNRKNKCEYNSSVEKSVETLNKPTISLNIRTFSSEYKGKKQTNLLEEKCQKIFCKITKNFNSNILENISKKYKSKKSKYAYYNYYFQKTKDLAPEYFKTHPYFEAKNIKDVKKIKTVYKFFEDKECKINYIPTVGEDTTYEVEYRFIKIKEEAFAVISIFNSIRHSSYDNFKLFQKDVIEKINIYIENSNRNTGEFKEGMEYIMEIIGKFSRLVSFYESESRDFLEIFEKTILELYSLKKNMLNQDEVQDLIRNLTSIQSEPQHLSNQFWISLEKLKALIIKYLKHFKE